MALAKKSFDLFGIETKKEEDVHDVEEVSDLAAKLEELQMPESVKDWERRRAEWLERQEEKAKKEWECTRDRWLSRNEEREKEMLLRNEQRLKEREKEWERFCWLEEKANPHRNKNCKYNPTSSDGPVTEKEKEKFEKYKEEQKLAREEERNRKTLKEWEETKLAENRKGLEEITRRAEERKVTLEESFENMKLIRPARKVV